jgi:hypothetical protein
MNRPRMTNLYLCLAPWQKKKLNSIERQKHSIINNSDTYITVARLNLFRQLHRQSRAKNRELKKKEASNTWDRSIFYIHDFFFIL